MKQDLNKIKEQVDKKPESDIKNKILKDIEKKKEHETVQK